MNLAHNIINDRNENSRRWRLFVVVDFVPLHNRKCKRIDYIGGLLNWTRVRKIRFIFGRSHYQIIPYATYIQNTHSNSSKNRRRILKMAFLINVMGTVKIIKNIKWSNHTKYSYFSIVVVVACVWLLKVRRCKVKTNFIEAGKRYSNWGN